MLSQEFQHLPCQNCNIQLNPPPCLCTFKNVIAEQASPKPDVKDINRNKLSKAERERERHTQTERHWLTDKLKKTKKKEPKTEKGVIPMLKMIRNLHLPLDSNPQTQDIY